MASLVQLRSGLYLYAMNKIVLDTNVLIDGVKDENSASWRIVEKCINGEALFFVSRPLKREYDRILRREINDENYLARISRLFSMAENVEIHGVERIVEEDPEDDKVLATALAAPADFLVSEDRHLLDLDPYGNLRIMKPKEFLNREEQDSSWETFAKMLGI